MVQYSSFSQLLKTIILKQSTILHLTERKIKNTFSRSGSTSMPLSTPLLGSAFIDLSSSISLLSCVLSVSNRERRDPTKSLIEDFMFRVIKRTVSVSLAISRDSLKAELQSENIFLSQSSLVSLRTCWGLCGVVGVEMMNFIKKIFHSIDSCVLRQTQS